VNWNPVHYDCSHYWPIVPAPDDDVTDHLCGHAASPATKKRAIMEETFPLRSVPGLHNED
jgi:hypothetical protein